MYRYRVLNCSRELGFVSVVMMVLLVYADIYLAPVSGFSPNLLCTPILVLTPNCFGTPIFQLWVAIIRIVLHPCFPAVAR